MNVRELETALLCRFPREDAESWDHIGLSVGDPSTEVTGVACALDATVENIGRALEMGANVLLTHHPVYIDAPDSFTPADPGAPSSAAAIYAAIQSGISIISLHTNLDRSLRVRRLLFDLLGFSAQSSLEWPDNPGRIGLGSMCRCDTQTLGNLAKTAARVFDSRPRVWGNPDRNVKRVAFLGGSLGKFGENAISAHADAVITGECGYHIAQDLCARGLAVVLLGHDRSEEPFCRILADAAVACGMPSNSVHIIPGAAQWWTVA